MCEYQTVAAGEMRVKHKTIIAKFFSYMKLLDCSYNSMIAQ